MNTQLPLRDLVLLGVGHTHAHIVRQWRMHPLPGVRLTCVSNVAQATYSGMMPGVLAGQYSSEEMSIDLVRFCASAGARLILGETSGVDRSRQCLLLEDHPPIPYDLLSIGVGSVPSYDGVEVVDAPLVPIKPMQTFLARMRSQCEGRPATTPGVYRVCVVGGGAGGVEIAQCLPPALARFGISCPLELWLVHGEDELARGLGGRARRYLMRHLEQRGVTVVLGTRVTRVESHSVWLDDGQHLEVDLVVWATGASPPPLVGRLDLERDARGFIATNSTLQSVSDPRVFAVGDTGSMVDHPLPKAGVYAVRQGPLLWRNLRAVLEGRPVRAYRPQRDFLRLINTGEGRAIADYHGWAVHAAWAWHWKDRIDRRFMAMYQAYEPPARMPAAPPPVHQKPRCTGCGSKLGGTVLRRVLARLDVPDHPAVHCGLDEPDDAALIQPGPGEPVSLTVDFFTAPVDDPYLFGRIAAMHAAGDCYAFGGEPLGAMAMVVVPEGPATQQERFLEDFLRGGLDELRRMGATLLGGHTMEGTQWLAGFSMVARHAPRQTWRKSRLQDGDRLVLTKPLGTGVLLAAHMQAACRAEWWEPLLASMLASPRPAAECARRQGIQAATDVTGFGLAGHLLEMLRASARSARLDLGRLPLLPGVAALLGEGWESTLAPANREVESSLDAGSTLRATPAYQALFDPQTSGGLLLAVPAERWDDFRTDYHERLGTPPICIGEVLGGASEQARIEIVE
jgi:selenide, water dikinase